MIIIIDGYNFLKQIFYYSKSKIKGDIDKVRSLFIKNLSFYKQKKGHEIIVVFDGGSFSKANREIHDGVVTIFSGYKESADEWIVDFIERNKGKEFLLVTNDRKLIDSAKVFDADSIDVFSFHNLVISNIEEKRFNNSKITNVQKYSYEDEEPESENNWNYMDFLIAQSDLGNYSKDDNDINKDLKSKSFKPSKEEKKIIKKIKKL